MSTQIADDLTTTTITTTDPPEYDQRKIPGLAIIVLIIEALVLVSLSILWILSHCINDPSTDEINNLNNNPEKAPALELPKKPKLSPSSDQIPSVITVSKVQSVSKSAQPTETVQKIPSQPGLQTLSTKSTLGPSDSAIKTKSSAGAVGPKVKARPSDSSVNVETDLMSIKDVDIKDKQPSHKTITSIESPN